MDTYEAIFMETDDRQLAEANEERMMYQLSLCQKVKRAMGESIALELAAEFGLTTEWRQHDRQG